MIVLLGWDVWGVKQLKWNWLNVNLLTTENIIIWCCKIFNSACSNNSKVLPNIWMSDWKVSTFSVSLLLSNSYGKGGLLKRVGLKIFLSYLHILTVLKVSNYVFFLYIIMLVGIPDLWPVTSTRYVIMFRYSTCFLL